MAGLHVSGRYPTYKDKEPSGGTHTASRSREIRERELGNNLNADIDHGRVLCGGPAADWRSSWPVSGQARSGTRSGRPTADRVNTPCEVWRDVLYRPGTSAPSAWSGTGWGHHAKIPGAVGLPGFLIDCTNRD